MPTNPNPSLPVPTKESAKPEDPPKETAQQTSQLAFVSKKSEASELAIAMRKQDLEHMQKLSRKNPKIQGFQSLTQAKEDVKQKNEESKKTESKSVQTEKKPEPAKPTVQKLIKPPSVNQSKTKSIVGEALKQVASQQQDKKQAAPAKK